MGNWRRVAMRGRVSEEDRGALEVAVSIGEDYVRFHCLAHVGGICGLGNWARSTEINALGNLSERDYGVESIVDALEKLVKVAPSLQLVVDVGADYESSTCIATVKVSGGVVSLHQAEAGTVAELDSESLRGRLFATVLESQQRQRRRV